MAEYETIRSGASGLSAAQIDQGLRAHMNKVYATMSGGMLITAAAAWSIAQLTVTSDPAGAEYALRQGVYLTGLGEAIYLSPLRWVIMFAPLAFLFLGWGALMRRGSAAVVSTGFFAFAAFMGLSLSSVFLVYTTYSITFTFLVASIAFMAMSLWGYVTKRDLSGVGKFLLMGLVALIIVMIAQLFIQSSVMQSAIAVIGTLIFAGLTAFETQRIKSDYVAHVAIGDQDWLDKAAIDGALGLYISLLNIFQFLLMLLGQQE